MYFLPIAFVAFCVTLGLTEWLVWICTRWRLLDHPNSERWHRSPTPRLGGVAMFVALVVSVLPVVHRPTSPSVYGLVGGVIFVFVWGLMDDLRTLPPLVKSLLLIASGVIPASLGVTFPVPSHVWGVVLTVAWVTGVTNAMNWLDNMDGVAAGVTTLSASALLALSLFTGNALGTVMAASLVGASLGFLVHNFPPARMFMGDCGSGLLGYMLAITMLVVTSGHPSLLPWSMLIAVFVLGVPILDMTLVIVQRMLHGRSILAGGRDHLAHRLAALGLSEREVVAVLYTLALASGAVAMLTFGGPSTMRPFAIAVGTLLIASLGITGSLVNVYPRPSLLRSYFVTTRSRYGAALLCGGLLTVGLVVLYYPMVTVLARQWLTDPDYSHGPLVPLFSAYLLWRRRAQFAQCRSAPCTFGYFVIVAGIVLYVLGAAAVVGYLMRVSLIVVLAGVILFLSGRQAFAIAAFPLGYLLFMIPPPYVVSDRITLPLQFLASNLATSALDIVGVPVFREGNIITLTAGQLAVSEACSGIRSLVALGAIATIYAYLAFPDWGRRGFIIMSAVPIAIVTNAARVMVTGLLAGALGLERAMGFYHAFSGLVIFALAVVLLLLEGTALSVIVPSANGKQAHAQSI